MELIKEGNNFKLKVGNVAIEAADYITDIWNKNLQTAKSHIILGSVLILISVYGIVTTTIPTLVILGFIGLVVGGLVVFKGQVLKKSVKIATIKSNYIKWSKDIPEDQRYYYYNKLLALHKKHNLLNESVIINGYNAIFEKPSIWFRIGYWLYKLLLVIIGTLSVLVILILIIMLIKTTY
jgi:hypothetical protein